MDPEQLLEAAVRLLAVPSTAERPDDLRRALDLVLDLVGPGPTVERFCSDGRPSALLYVGDRRPETFRVILNAHLDVVPAAPEQFVPRHDGDRLYARGAQDMKVSALVLATVFRELATVLPYPIALQLVTDEEIGGHHGTRHQLEQGVRGDFVVIGEHSGLELVVDSKGITEVSLVARGRGGHGAYPWLGDNALLKLMRSIDRLMERYPEPAAEVWRTTVNVAHIDTDNTAVNQIPAHARARLDIRFPADDVDLTSGGPDEVAGYLRGFCEPGVTVTVHRIDPPHRVDRDRPEVAALRRAARREGYPAGFLRKHGAADSRFYSQRGIDAVIFGVGGDGQHGPEEYVDLTTVDPYHRALRGFLTDLAGT
ncbi:MAG: M20/M25/M40 family metallo-hydrolase [Actinocatenispora sp.]